MRFSSSWKCEALELAGMTVETAFEPFAHPANSPSHKTYNTMRRENTNKPQMFHCNETSCKYNRTTIG